MTDSDKIQTLPLPFLERMKEMLGDDYDAFLKSYKNPRTYGLRVNTAKLCQLKPWGLVRHYFCVDHLGNMTSNGIKGQGW